MSVTYQTLNMSNGGGNQNLLINPRGKINQANESGGVLSAGQYFCDGWKAGAAGAEVYRDADGFRLISGSILQLVPNILDSGRKIMGNMDAIQGSPVIRINGGTDSELSNDQIYITFEVTGNNSKFTRLILAESDTPPIYQQKGDELEPCKSFLQVYGNDGNTYPLVMNDYDIATQYSSFSYEKSLHKTPALVIKSQSTPLTYVNIGINSMSVGVASSKGAVLIHFMLDARP